MPLDAKLGAFFIPRQHVLGMKLDCFSPYVTKWETFGSAISLPKIRNFNYEKTCCLLNAF